MTISPPSRSKNRKKLMWSGCIRALRKACLISEMRTILERRKHIKLSKYDKLFINCVFILYRCWCLCDGFATLWMWMAPFQIAMHNYMSCLLENTLRTSELRDSHISWKGTYQERIFPSTTFLPKAKSKNIRMVRIKGCGRDG